MHPPCMRQIVILSYDEMAAICPRVPDDGLGSGLEAAIRRHLSYLRWGDKDKWSPHIERALEALNRVESSVAK